MKYLRILCLLFTILCFHPAFADDIEENSSIENQIITESYQIASGEPFKVLMDITAGEVDIRPSDKDSLCNVSVTFPTKKYKGKAEYDEKKNRFRLKVSGKMMNSSSNKAPHVVVELPPGIRTLLHVKVKAGEVDMDLGGISLRECKVSHWAGELRVDFAEQNPDSCENLDINLKVGESNIRNLGNACFKKAKINSGIGECRVDFSGALLNKSKAKVDLDIGEARVMIPGDCGARMIIGGMMSWMSSKNIDSEFIKQGRYYESVNYDTAPKKFALLVTPGLGELRIDMKSKKN